ILIPPSLRAAAELESSALLVGAINKVEIWNPAKFEAAVKSATPDFQQFAANIFRKVETGGGYHEAVMVAEVLKYLRPERGGLYFDGTLGGGGHTEAILRAGGNARVIGVDRDAEALEVAEQRLRPWSDRVELVHANFADAAESD